MKSIRVLLLCLVCAFPIAVSTAQDAPPGGLAALAQSGIEGPIVVMDLVQFKAGGEAEYDKYDKIAEAKLTALGGEVVFRGSALRTQGIPSAEWDRVTLRKYPTVQAVLAMGSSKEYRGAFPHRLASVTKSFVYAFSGELPSIGGAPSTAKDPMRVVPPPTSPDTIYMLNLLRFNDEGGREMYYGQYGSKTIQMIQALGGGPVLILKGAGAVISDEEVDRFILVKYPSPDAFRGMVASDEYAAVSHFRTEAIELGLVWPFVHDRTPVAR